MDIDTLIKTMQAAISPGVMIAGFGFLLLTMTNRLGRTVDRIRALDTVLHKDEGEYRNRLCQQIQVLYKRAKILRTAIALITSCIFFVSIIEFLVFAAIILNVNIAKAIYFFFGLSILCLISSLIFFLIDISMTLKSIKIEIGKHLDQTQ